MGSDCYFSKRAFCISVLTLNKGNKRKMEYKCSYGCIALYSSVSDFWHAVFIAPVECSRCSVMLPPASIPMHPPIRGTLGVLWYLVSR